MWTCSGAHAGDEKVVEPPGLDGNLLELVAEHRNSEALQREVLADMGYDADAAGAAAGAGSASSGGGAPSNKPGDVIDAEYVDVDENKRPN